MDTVRIFAGLLVCASLVSPGAWAGDAKGADDYQAYIKQMAERASQGDTQAQVCEGDLYATFGKSPDYGSALKWYQTAADAGEPLGKLRIAQQYQYGYGVPRDPAKAMTLFRDLFKQGYLPAATAIGELYFTGAGVPLDYLQALDWFTKAAAGHDYWAEAHLGVVFQIGFGVKRNPSEARKWSLRAADHRIACLPTFGQLIPLIVNGYVNMPAVDDPSRVGSLTISYSYDANRAEDVTLQASSGNEKFDYAWLDATRRAKLPPWPVAYRTDSKTLSFTIPGANSGIDPDFIRALRTAIDAAKVVPKEAASKGSMGTGIAIVSFDYLDGAVSDARIETSSSDPQDDAAAIQAVEHASYPPPPEEDLHKKLHLSISVVLHRMEPAAATASAPAAATGSH